MERNVSSWTFFAYYGISVVLHPIITRLVYITHKRKAIPKLSDVQVQSVQAAFRFSERLGTPSKTRLHSGPLIWFHGASIGESVSALTLVQQYLREWKDIQVQILLTAGTAGGVDYLQQMVSNQNTLLKFERTFVQFYPLDTPPCVNKFLNHWNPQGVIFVESELWPNMIHQIHKRKIPMALINGRMSPSSFARWNRFMFRGLASQMLSQMKVCLGQTPEDVQRLAILGASQPKFVGNLKIATLSAPVDTTQLTALRSAIGNRKAWCAACTHEGEEEIVAQVHMSLVQQFPDLLTILVPRHPHRANHIRKMLENKLNCCLRSEVGTAFDASTSIYIGDTIGEMPLFYSACSVIFLGGSLVPRIGGHNPLEPAQRGCCLLHGPYVQNNKILYDQLKGKRSESLWEVSDSLELKDAIQALLLNHEARNLRIAALRDAARDLREGVMNAVWAELESFHNSVLKKETV
eukprot:TRINITY_DN2479_c0_g1_i2.p1 TRINITY_DN2479_c0_g1~~TRINITY_DN2479_c0_g1_i2.p1  ORF type:complete len:464 (+),score=48.27 TRINITY_DN2479_c0_g1_i2:102-1493(+)